ncbi:hypothetical protein [Streptomyces sp. NPDC001743]
MLDVQTVSAPRCRASNFDAARLRGRETAGVELDRARLGGAVP